MPVFSRVINENWGGHSLFNSYARNKDTLSKGKTPFGYYAEITSRSFLSLMTRPGSFKYFRSPILSIIGKILAYPWMIFWLLGFFIGISKIKRSIHYQFLLCIVVYFIFASIIILTLATGERYRLPMMPFLAIISALGWSSLSNKESKNEDTCYPKR